MPGSVLRVAERVHELVGCADPEARVYVFGSAARCDLTAASDIDMLVLTERLELKCDIRGRVCKAVEEPVELHVVDRRKLEEWY